MQDCWD